jgi:hypothetical protein
VTVVGSYVCALVAAPYQQRNVLRARLSESGATIAALQTTPVTQKHGDRLRRIANGNQACIELGDPPDYDNTPDTLRRGFDEHFPEVKSALDRLRETDAPFAALKERLRSEVAKAGMDVVPWTSAMFVPTLAATLETCAAQGNLGGDIEFDWQEDGSGSGYIGGNADNLGTPVFIGCAPIQVSLFQEKFEEFFRSTERLPEVTDLRRASMERDSARKTAIGLLSAVANTDPIVSRCFLCRGSSGGSPGQT